MYVKLLETNYTCIWSDLLYMYEFLLIYVVQVVTLKLPWINYSLPWIIASCSLLFFVFIAFYETVLKHYDS